MVVWQKYAALLAVLVISVVTGCKPPQQAESTPSISDRDRPPLRIGLVSQPESLQETIKTRFATVSELKLEFITLRDEDVDGGESPQLDIIVAPAHLLGTMVEGKWNSELPKELVENQLTSRNSDDSKTVAFPQHWLSLAQYGKAYYGVPFGASLVLAGLPVDQTSKQQSRSKSSLAPSLSLDWSKYRLSKTNDTNPLSSDIVDHFLVVASSYRPDVYDASLLFKLLDCSSRLSEPWAVQSVTTLRELYSANAADRLPLTLGLDLSQPDTGNIAWQVPTVKRASTATNSASPNSTGDASKDVSDWSALTDSTHSPIFLLSASTRQSSKSIFFLNWICEQGQRTALAKNWPCSFPVSEGASLPNGYRDVAYKASNADDISTFFKLRHGSRYRAVLHRTLTSIVTDPSLDVARSMEECRLECDNITESLGRDFQQDSLERSLNLQ